MNEEFDNELPNEEPENNAQDETQKSEPKRTMVVFLAVYQIITIVLTWTWNFYLSDWSLKLVTQTGHLNDWWN